MVKLLRLIASLTLLFFNLNCFNTKGIQRSPFELIEGDMMVDKSHIDFILRKQKRGAVQNTAQNYFWLAKKDSQGKRIIVVPYKLRFGFFQRKEKQAFRNAVQYFKRHTCVRFQEKKDDKKEDHIDVFKGVGCWAQIGRREGGQQVSIGAGCEVRSKIVHELMHVLGFLHEHTRMDRDQHVRVIDTNILDGHASEFNKYKQNTAGLPYDFRSVMHYTKKHFTKNEQNTIEARIDPSMPLGNDEGLSSLDVIRINMLYQCPQLRKELVEYPVTVYTSNVWFAGTDGVVDLVLLGSRGDCGEVELGAPHSNPDPFERESTEKFHVVCPLLGKLVQLKVMLQNAGWLGAWKLDKIEIWEPQRQKTAVFHCNQWIYNNGHVTLRPSS